MCHLWVILRLVLKVTKIDSRNLQLFIQHCMGVAREAIESCVNLPASEGYISAKRTLRQNVGLPHIIAKAHLKKLECLPPLKNCGGSTLLEFARSLEVADRDLRGMGHDYVDDLNQPNTLLELSRKLPFFIRGKWAEQAGRIIGAGERPRFSDFLKFVKDRANLENNEFKEDLVVSPSKERRGSEDMRVKSLSRATPLATKFKPDPSKR